MLLVIYTTYEYSRMYMMKMMNNGYNRQIERTGRILISEISSSPVYLFFCCGAQKKDIFEGGDDYAVDDRAIHPKTNFGIQMLTSFND